MWLQDDLVQQENRKEKIVYRIHQPLQSVARSRKATQKDLQATGSKVYPSRMMILGDAGC